KAETVGSWSERRGAAPNRHRQPRHGHAGGSARGAEAGRSRDSEPAAQSRRGQQDAGPRGQQLAQATRIAAVWHILRQSGGPAARRLFFPGAAAQSHGRGGPRKRNEVVSPVQEGSGAGVRALSLGAPAELRRYARAPPFNPGQAGDLVQDISVRLLAAQ